MVYLLTYLSFFRHNSAGGTAGVDVAGNGGIEDSARAAVAAGTEKQSENQDEKEKREWLLTFT